MLVHSGFGKGDSQCARSLLHSLSLQVSGGAIMLTFVTGADVQSLNCSRAGSQVPHALEKDLR